MYVALRVQIKLLFNIVFIQRMAQRVVTKQDRDNGHTWPMGQSKIVSQNCLHPEVLSSGHTGGDRDKIMETFTLSSLV